MLIELLMRIQRAFLFLHFIQLTWCIDNSKSTSWPRRCPTPWSLSDCYMGEILSNDGRRFRTILASCDTFHIDNFECQGWFGSLLYAIHSLISSLYLRSTHVNHGREVSRIRNPRHLLLNVGSSIRALSRSNTPGDTTFAQVREACAR